ncbi:Transcriptional regulator, LuxR family protein [Minicystis rosea]|nr:Transcriptional regulator, LuxR family protein [Minicystis rosea]
MVRFDELQRVLRLAMELRELPRGSMQQRRHALEGLRALVGAQVALWAHVDGMLSGQVMIRNALDLGFCGDGERRMFLAYIEDAQWTSLDPSMPRLARAVSSPVSTFTREQLLDGRDWYGSTHVQEFRRAARVDSFIYATYAPGGDESSSISLHRAWGERPFCERERRIIDIFSRECTFLHEPRTDVDPTLCRGLAPRLQDTLRALARGQSEKQVAASLGLSPHTVHEYVKALYRHFGVQSRSELLAMCLAGG